MGEYPWRTGAVPPHPPPPTFADLTDNGVDLRTDNWNRAINENVNDSKFASEFSVGPMLGKKSRFLLQSVTGTQEYLALMKLCLQSLQLAQQIFKI